MKLEVMDLVLQFWGEKKALFVIYFKKTF